MKGMKWLWIAYYGRVLVGFAVDKEEKSLRASVCHNSFTQGNEDMSDRGVTLQTQLWAVDQGRRNSTPIEDSV